MKLRLDHKGLYSVNTRLYIVILGHAVFWLYLDILGCTGLYRAVLDYTGLYLTILGYTKLYWAIIALLYWAILLYKGYTASAAPSVSIRAKV